MDTKTSENKIPRINFQLRKKFTITVVAVIAFVLAFLVIAFYITNERKRQVAITESRLIDIIESNSEITHKIVEDYANILRALAAFVKNVDDYISEDTLGILKDMADAFGFERLFINLPDGISYTTDGIVCNGTDEKYLGLIKSGQFFITDVTDSTIDGTHGVSIHVPLIKNGIAVAALSYYITGERLDIAIKTHFLNEIAYSIVDEQGRYVAISHVGIFESDSNFFDNLAAITFNKGFSKEMMVEDFANLKPGRTEHLLNGEFLVYGYYAPVGINNWMMLTIIPELEVNANTNRFLISAFTFAVQILVIFIIVAIFVYLDQRKAHKITELNERYFHILAENTGKVVFSWDFINKTIQSPSKEQVIVRKLFEADFKSAENAISAGVVHPDDGEALRKMVADVTNGHNLENLRLRLRITDGTYHFFSVSSVVIFDSKEKPYKSIGFMENIDQQVRTEDNLRHRANIDQLTELYNKAAAEALISEAISSSDDKTKNALLCVDLDNFKSINDKFGHLYGDKVLKEATDNIKKLFRTSDIIGRFGGDEFVIFVRDIPSMSFIEEKAAELNKRLNKTYRNDDIECSVSASIGIAVYPTDGGTYKTLYQKADEASFVVKNKGKNSYSFFAQDK